MADKPDLPESVKRWLTNCDAETARMNQASSVEAIAEMAGLPKWKVFKVVSLELEEIVHARRAIASAGYFARQPPRILLPRAHSGLSERPQRGSSPDG